MDEGEISWQWAVEELRELAVGSGQGRKVLSAEGRWDSWQWAVGREERELGVG